MKKKFHILLFLVVSTLLFSCTITENRYWNTASFCDTWEQTGTTFCAMCCVMDYSEVGYVLLEYKCIIRKEESETVSLEKNWFFTTKTFKQFIFEEFKNTDVYWSENLVKELQNRYL